jgi:hypothetical protein
MVSMDPTARLLHIANGTSTTGLLGAAGIAGSRSIWADPLYEGPVPAALSDLELMDVRMRYLAGAASGEENLSFNPVNDLREWRAAIARHEPHDELVLWFEHDLFDQLNLIQLLTWLQEHLPPSKPVSLVCVGSFPGRPDFKGLGELTPVELASLIETRQSVGPAQSDLARRAWQAFRAPTPEALDALRQDGTLALPYLAPAISRFLQEYPWTSDGLSRTERRLLELAAGDGIVLGKALGRMHEGERSYYVTDLSLSGLAEALARTSPPLLTLDRADGRHDGVLHGVAKLTDAGRSILAGHLDRIETCGIDRWLGGVHLSGRAVPWRWNDGTEAIVAP